LFGLTTGSLLIMYALWRWHDTLPTFAFSVQNFWQYFFFAFEALAIVYTLMSIVILFRSIDRGPGSRELMERQSERLDKYPEVKGKVTASSP
jgi:cellulose synthase (UDP-forming)